MMMKLSIVIPCFVVLYVSACCADYDVSGSGSHSTVQSASLQELGLKRRVKSKSEVVQTEEAKSSKKAKAKSSKSKKSKSSKSSKSWEYPKITKSPKSESKESKSSSSKVSIKSSSKSKRSKSATDSPSMSPTLAPVASTSAPTEALTEAIVRCELSEEGIFGESSSTTQDVTYYYQMEHEISADTDTIIADLERNVLNQIITSSGLFEDCNEDGSGSSNPDVIGLSIAPDDESFSCTPDAPGCVIVKAQFTFYMTDERFRRLTQEEEPDYLTAVLEFIEAAYEGDVLKSVSDDITGLTYLGTEDPNAEIDKEIVPRSGNGGGGTGTGGTDVPLIAVASSFGTLFLIAIAAGVRKQRRANISEEKVEDNGLLEEVEDEETLEDGNTIGDNTLEGENTVEGNNTIEGDNTMEGDGDHTIDSGEDHTFECEFTVDFDKEEEFEC